jgi:hypothetical protein
VNKQQLKDSLFGVRLLTGHMQERGERLDGAILSEQPKTADSYADPLVNVAVLLVRQLRTAIGASVADALARCRPHTRAEFSDFVTVVEGLVSQVISGSAPKRIGLSPTAVAIGAQEIGTAAAVELGAIQSAHPKAIVSRIRKRLREQGEEVQLFDKESAEIALTAYAGDPGMKEIRFTTARALFQAINDTAVNINSRLVSITSETSEPASKSILNGLCLVSVTGASLGAGVQQLIFQNNHYAASALLRQLVEVEFLLWKFAQDCDEIPGWVNSTREERERNWKPSRIYRDAENDYRQKDYSGHCELGGHPTPVGAEIAAGVRSDIAEASLLCDLINHLRDSWTHILKAIEKVEQRYPHLAPLAADGSVANVEEAVVSWRTRDRYIHSSTYFSDPID